MVAKPKAEKPFYSAGFKIRRVHPWVVGTDFQLIEMNFEEEIRKVLKDGEIAIGRKKVKKGLVTGTVKMVIVASSAPAGMMEDVKRYSQLSGIPYYVFQGDAKELGYACAKPFPISSLAIVKEGGSKILSLTKQR